MEYRILCAKVCNEFRKKKKKRFNHRSGKNFQMFSILMRRNTPIRNLNVRTSMKIEFRFTRFNPDWVYPTAKWIALARDMSSGDYVHSLFYYFIIQKVCFIFFSSMSYFVMNMNVFTIYKFSYVYEYLPWTINKNI